MAVPPKLAATAAALIAAASLTACGSTSRPDSTKAPAVSGDFTVSTGEAATRVGKFALLYLFEAPTATTCPLRLLLLDEAGAPGSPAPQPVALTEGTPTQLPNLGATLSLLRTTTTPPTCVVHVDHRPVG